MHSFGRVLVLGGLLCMRGALATADATITPAPTTPDVRLRVKRQDSPDPILLARILLTAVPESLRQIAATNIPAASSILYEEFIDGKRPEWFLELPDNIQSYLVREFGPKTAWPTAPPTNSGWTWPSATATSTSSSSTGSSATTQIRSSGTHKVTDGSSTRQSVSTASASPTTLLSSRRPSSTPPSEDSSTSTSLLSASPTASTTSSASSTPVFKSPAATNDGLTRGQKIGLGVGIPIGLVGAAAILFAFCTINRRRQKKNVDGSIPPSSPGFIPRFAFQERPADDTEHRTPLTRDVNPPAADLGQQQHVDWEDDGVDPADTVGMHNPYTMNTPYTLNNYDASTAGQGPQNTMLGNPYSASFAQGAGMAMHDSTPIMAPALYHTHSSNCARGMRTSYTSLRSVAEVTEPDESEDAVESPILGRQISPKHGASSPRNLLPTPPVPAGATIKRKPISPSPPPPPVPKSPPISATPAANLASHKLLRQTMPEHSGSSSSGLALTMTTTGTTSSSGLSSASGLVLPANNSTPATDVPSPSPVSPLSSRAASNPFQYDSYVEDYGPEYQGAYIDVEDGLYGGHTSLSRYPEARRGSGSGGRRSSKTEWPLRNLVGSGHRRKSSPLWDRINED